MLGEVPPWELDVRGKSWAGSLKELSYDIEDVLDAFMVQTEGLRPTNPKCCFMGLFNKTITKNNISRRTIADEIKYIKVRIGDVAGKHARYRVDDIAAQPVRTEHALGLFTLFEEPSNLVGTGEAVHNLISRLIGVGGDGVSEQQLKIVSVVGFGGLGKTTIAYQVYERLREKFYCGAFVSLSRNPNMKKVLSDLLRQIRPGSNQASKDLTGLIDKLKEILQNMRYLIVVDDIWDKKSWTAIKRAMVENNLGSRIITTTRIFKLAEEIGEVYRIKPLSPGDSKRLFCRRIFGEDRCPIEFTEVCDNIINKCGGLPLAIISIARLWSTSLEVNRWRELYNIIGSGHYFEPRMEGMARSLLLSYYDLPFHVRNCLLHTSVFPEDYKIRRDRLVCRWIAEGYVEEKQGSNLLEVGQSYFRELLNTGVIEEFDINDGSDDTVKYCRIHTIMLDAIRFLSKEESSGSQGKVRRLSLPTSEGDSWTSEEVATMCMSKVRSVTAFGPGINQMPALSRFEVLRVMDLEGCQMKQSYGLKHIGKLLHLRYLGLRDTLIAELPEEIGSLRFLQILDIVRTDIKEVPWTVAQLQQLMCLYVDHKTRLPDKMGNLTSLVELSKVSTGVSPNFVKELHKLTELTALGIVWHEINEALVKELLETLGNMEKLQTLNVYACSAGSAVELMGEGWVTPPDLRTFVVRDGWFSLLPSWISSSLKLTKLNIGVRVLRQEDMEALGRLQELVSLQLAVEHSGGQVVVGAGAFPRLRELRIRGETCQQLVFQQGAAPKVRVLEVLVNVEDAIDGLVVWVSGSLPSLEELYVGIPRCGDARRRQEAEKALMHAANVHPNRPTFHVVSEKYQEDEPRQISNVTQEIPECSTSTSMCNASQS
ncbi:hypothetical protein E2562_026745 [Oryza meyeriana var. granulata]|uniref:Uncharacterized protein n=1 Tax=Oryza meyeriana var. granulata TaxID=110450 RepID=A0A6G1C8Z8_9ORYZ|nr:hypothetical protein E2562_026745 [Oryza meyeriana var. granulata]